MAKVKINLQGYLATDFYKIDCELGWRKMHLVYRDVNNARAFVELVLGKNKWKWKAEDTIVALAADTLKIQSTRLEDIMESKGKGVVHATDQERIKQFLTGVWHQDVPTTPDRRVRRPDKEDDDKPRKTKAANGSTVSLAEICKRNGWDDRRARRHLRTSGAQRDGRWSWPPAEVAGIEEQLRAVFK
jgi:hypothetical protein